MNETQQQILLWSWSRRRKRGRGGVVLLGAGVGAAGGIVFAVLMLLVMQGSEIRINEDEMGPWMAAIARAIGPVGFLFLLAVPAFAFVGFIVANRAWFMQEGLYQSLLDQGARVPSEKPKTTLRDWIPTIVLFGFFALIAIGLSFGVWWEYWGKQ